MQLKFCDVNPVSTDDTCGSTISPTPVLSHSEHFTEQRLSVSPFSPRSVSESDDSVSVASSASAMNRKFKIPDTWRPSIMHCIEQPTNEEKLKCLTPQIRNEIVRDVVAQMFAFEPKPKKCFVTQVAQQLIKKYPFLKDVGQCVSGYVSCMYHVC